MKEIEKDPKKLQEKIGNFLTDIGEIGLLSYLTQSDFFRAPASTVFHGNCEGGLVQHSWAVGILAGDIAESLGVPSVIPSLTSRSFGMLLGLVHDLCKVNFYKPDTRNVKTADGWTKVPCYTVLPDNTSYGHGLTSYLRAEENLDHKHWATAIRYPVIYHMGSYDVSEMAAKGYQQAQNDFPWLTILQSADQLAAFVFGV